MASPSVLAMLLTANYVEGLPLHRFEKVLGATVSISRVKRWHAQ